MLSSKKLIVLLALFTLLIGSAAMAQDDGLKLTGWPYQVDVVTENLGRFTDQYGWDAEFLPFPSNEYRDKMVASFVAGTEFDVAYVRDSYLAEWAAAGWIQPITGLEGAEELLADLPQGIIDQMSFEGEVYGLPYYSGVQTLAYNAAHLEAAGIMSPPETWDEMLQQAQMIKDAGIVEYPIFMSVRSGENYLLREWETLTAARGGKLFDDDFNPLFQEEGSAAWEALDWLTTGLDMGVIDPASLTNDDPGLLLAAGTSTFQTTTDYALKAMNDPEQSMAAGDIKNALIPGTDEVRSGTWGYVRLYAITNNTQDKDAAWQLVQFLGGKDATGVYYVPKRWALEFGLGFSPAPLYEDEEVRNSISGWIDPDLLSEQSEYAISRPYRFVPYFSDWEIGSWGPLQAAILGDADKGQVLADLAEEWNDLREEWE
ncbi:MAG: extracellular solute-binding protein [Chloroflexi bacterium]|nr:extracellular solute-binding protein [Chloroflexota bacterium]MCY3581498.1 extracellular solute-binding protein [Chloroflexota bacterium]MCY3715142.1 extracellular solute-binding protein [Chloroflexota bacterium]MXV93939.1 extracellular solute-binding protein [Chloroflexota bacterium]MXX49714.1 extracellular solute-binding protein [Chloroflexota bacterium]